MLAELEKYYRIHGIYATDFSCPNFRYCQKTSPETFTTAKAAFVSTGYESHLLPRILFLSLDSGSADIDPNHKTLEYVRHREEIERNVLTLPKHKHWYRTHELAYILLRHFKPDLRIEDAKHYFAHTNSAKCCMNNPGRSQANSTLFNNCRRFIPGEIRVLDPDVLITQGAHAFEAINLAFKHLDLRKTSWSQTGLPEEVNLIEVNEKPVIWIHTIHPRNPGSKKNRDSYQAYEKFVKEFFSEKTFSFSPIFVGNSLPLENTNNIETTSVDKKGDTLMNDIPGNYVWLAIDPPTPKEKYPSKEECLKFDYLKMSQLCEISEKKKIGRSRACNAFGGDKGQYKVVSERQSRAVRHKSQPRKYVLTTAAIAYLREFGVTDW